MVLVSQSPRRCAVLLAACAWLLIGCSSSESDVAHLSSSADSGSTQHRDEVPGDDNDLLTEQRASAEALQECLAGELIGSSLQTFKVVGREGQFLAVVPDPISEEYLVYVPGVGGFASPRYNDQVEEFTSEGPKFIDGTQDYSDVYIQCMDESGFFVPDARIDPNEEATIKLAQADASNRWAECARQFGYPGIKDTSYTVDNWETTPEVVIPAEIPADELRSLLAECPYGEPESDVQPRLALGMDPADPNYQALREILVESLLATVPEG
jgi:hypothetical protein